VQLKHLFALCAMKHGYVNVAAAKQPNAAMHRSSYLQLAYKLHPSVSSDTRFSEQSEASEHLFVTKD